MRSLGELVAVWHNPTVERIAPRLDADPSKEYRGDFSRAYYTLSQAHHAVRLADAVLVLYEAGLPAQASPLIRQTMECAVTAAWLSATPGSADAFAFEGMAQRRKLGLGLAKVANIPVEETFVPDLTKLAEEFAPSESEEARNFLRRTEALAGSNWLYPFYRHLSGYSHSGSAILDLYFHPEDVRWDENKPFEWGRMTIGIEVMMLHLAIRAWDDLCVGHPMRQRLDEIAERHGMSTTIRRADTPPGDG